MTVERQLKYLDFWTNNENSSPAEHVAYTRRRGRDNPYPTFTWTESDDEDLYDVIGYTLKYGTDPTDLDPVEPFDAGTNVNYSLSFDGEDDYIMMENFQIPDSIYDATIELWFKSNIDPQSFSEEGFQGAHLFKKSGLYDLRLFEDSLGFEWESNIFGIQEGCICFRALTMMQIGIIMQYKFRRCIICLFRWR